MSPAAVEWHSDSPTQHVVKAPHKRLPVGADEASPGDAAEFPRPSLQLSAQQPPRCQRNPWMQRAGHRLAYVLFSQDRGRKRSVSQLVVPTARIEVSSSYSCLSQTCKILQVTERSRTGDLKIRHSQPVRGSFTPRHPHCQKECSETPEGETPWTSAAATRLNWPEILISRMLSGSPELALG